MCIRDRNIYLVMADDAAVEHVIQLYGPTKIPIKMCIRDSKRERRKEKINETKL